MATATLFVAEGAKVVITGRNQATLDAAAKELGPNALARRRRRQRHRRDRSGDQAGRRKIRQVSTSLFVNAGIAGATPLGAATLEVFEKVISTNLTAVFFTVQAALPYLNDNASIVLNGSVISVLGNPGYSAYGASKAGVRALARIMASELSPRGIRVNVVAPGATRTPIWGAATATPEAEKVFEARMDRSTPLGRLGEPDHIAKTVCSSPPTMPPISRRQELFVDGGATASPAGAPIYRG